MQARVIPLWSFLFPTCVKLGQTPSMLPLQTPRRCLQILSMAPYRHSTGKGPEHEHQSMFKARFCPWLLLMGLPASVPSKTSITESRTCCRAVAVHKVMTPWAIRSHFVADAGARKATLSITSLVLRFSMEQSMTSWLTIKSWITHSGTMSQGTYCTLFPNQLILQHPGLKYPFLYKDMDTAGASILSV